MHPAIAYLVKMLLCSAVLLGYYWLALRNERFHHWNRFYLLSAMFLSVVVPFVNVPLLPQNEPTAVVTVLAAFPWNQLTVDQAPAFSWGWKETLMLVTGIVSLAMLLHLVISVARVIRMYRSHTHTWFKEVSVVITEEQAAPFSFFKWLFWRNDIDPDSENGQRMLQHELTHIRERHSADKLFAELLLILFWMNPFFWIMRRELYAIHEFLADQKAIARHDGAAFASMILLATHPGQTPTLSNPFFTSHLKRRLIMITTSHAPKYSYLRRISGLVLMVCTAVLLVLSIDQATAQKTPPPPPTKAAPVAPADPADPETPAIADSINTINIWDKKGVAMVTYTMKDGRVLKMTVDEAKKKGYPVTPPPAPPAPPAPGAPPAPPAPPAKKGATTTATNEGIPTGAKAPLYYYDGILISEEHAKMIDPKNIATINVWKGENAIERFGESAENGVVEIMPKSSEPVPVTLSYPANASEVQSKSSMMSLISNSGLGDKKPLILLNDKEISEEEMKRLKTKDIMEIRIEKGPEAFRKYGAKAMNGVIRIMMGC